MSKIKGDYIINEKDIDSFLNVLKRVDPEHATPEMAIQLIEFYIEKFHEIGHEDPEMLEEMYKEFSKKRTKN